MSLLVSVYCFSCSFHWSHWEQHSSLSVYSDTAAVTCRICLAILTCFLWASQAQTITFFNFDIYVKPVRDSLLHAGSVWTWYLHRDEKGSDYRADDLWAQNQFLQKRNRHSYMSLHISEGLKWMTMIYRLFVVVLTCFYVTGFVYVFTFCTFIVYLTKTLCLECEVVGVPTHLKYVI